MKSKNFIDPKAAEKFLKKGKHHSAPSTFIKGIKKSNIVLLSQAITLCESTKSEDLKIAEEILAATDAYPKHSIRIGITGSPGVGKSTFIESIGMHLLKQGKKVAVLAVDPSSQLSKGSILGDKTRMTLLSKQENAFIRPTAAGDQLGGVSKTTQESISLCEMAGFDVIIVETVGVGQSEIMVHSMTDIFILLIQPGAGDELQGIKKGIVEMADMIVVNKADGNKTSLAKQARGAYANAIHLLSRRADDWTVKVLTCSALEKTGIEEVWKHIKAYKKHVLEKKLFIAKRKKQNVDWFQRTLQSAYLDLISKNKALSQEITKLESQIHKGKLSPFKASKDIFERISVLFKS